MTILCLDIGNTSITYCKVIDSKFQSLDRYASSDKLSSLLDSIDLSNVHAVVISSVVPSLSKKLYDLINKNIRNPIIPVIIFKLNRIILIIYFF